MSDAIRFIRKNGRIIPIAARTGADHSRIARAAVHTSRAVGIGVAAHEIKKGLTSKNAKQPIKVNKFADAASLGLSIASGAIGAVTFTGGAKRIVGGALGVHAVDAVGIAANAASVAGHGKAKERGKQFARQEARNLLVGNAVYAAGIVGIKKNRVALAGYASKVIAFAKKVIR